MNVSMPKRCEDVGCASLAADGSCLMPKNERANNCPARETIGHEDKDNWMLDLKPKTTEGGIGTLTVPVRKRKRREP